MRRPSKSAEARVIDSRDITGQQGIGWQRLRIALGWQAKIDHDDSHDDTLGRQLRDAEQED